MDKKSLLKAMEGKNSLCEWDVMCSYNEEKINSLLSQKYEEGKLVSNVKFDLAYYDEIFDENVTIKLELQLKEPKLEFIVGDGHRCKLTMPVKGGKYITQVGEEKEKSTDIPGDYLEITSIAPMVSIKANYEEGGSKETSTSTTYGAKEIVRFKEDGVETAQVTLHFQNDEDVVFDIIKVDKEAKDNALLQHNIKPNIINEIKSFFHNNVSEIAYSLGGITNAEIEDKVELIPKSFIFSSSKPDTTKQGSLNIYIRTREGDDPEDNSPVFSPSNKKILPIPDGYTASLIISRDLLIQEYLKNQFKEIGWNIEEVESSKGINLKLKKDQTFIIKGKNTDNGVEKINIDDIVISLESFPIQINIDSKDKDETDSIKGNMEIIWEFKQRVHWSYKANAGGYKASSSGNVDVSLTYNKEHTLEFDEDKGLSFKHTMNKDDIVITAEKSKKVFDIFGFGNEFLGDIKGGITLDEFNFDFSIKDIGVFAVTNLLFPGKEVFNIDTAKGFHVPSDLILFGYVSESLNKEDKEESKEEKN